MIINDDVRARVERLRSGNHQFGCGGDHRGIGTLECPREPHHHHDLFCEIPSAEELFMAGLDPEAFKPASRQ